MKSLKILSTMLLLAATLVGCDKDNTPSGGVNSKVVGEWMLTGWNGEATEFNVYLDLNSDATFAIYQQVWTLGYELFEGTFKTSGEILTGTYADGTNWASGYKFAVDGDMLTMYSQEDISITSVYEKCEIPQSIIDEATTTRASGIKPIL